MIGGADTKLSLGLGDQRAWNVVTPDRSVAAVRAVSSPFDCLECVADHMRRNLFRKWAAPKGGERSMSQSDVLNLCKLLGEPGAADSDPTGENDAFEKGVKSPGGDGFADVWLLAHFAWG